MRADQWLMLGVIGLGVYAIYKMSKTEKQQPQIEPIKQIPKLPTTELPMVPGPIPQLPTNIFSLQGSQIELTNSRAYFGRIETISPTGNSFPAPFSYNASKDQLIDALQNFGFDAVRVYMTPSEADQAITLNEALANPGRGTRWFYGRWLGPTTRVPRPAEFVLLWITKGLPIISGLIAPGIYPKKAKALGMCNYPYRWKYYNDYYKNCIAGAIFDPNMTNQFQYVMKD